MYVRMQHTIILRSIIYIYIYMSPYLVAFMIPPNMTR